MRGFINCLVILLLALSAAQAGPPQQPVIGIYTLPANLLLTEQSVPETQTYIASSYVKNLEMAGAQVIPLPYHYSEQQLEVLLGKINGVFFTGGTQYIDITNPWTSKAAFIVQYAKKQNRDGNPYPIWATCLGLQAMMYVTSGAESNETVFSDIEDQDEVVEPLTVYNRNSKLLAQLSPQEYNETTSGEGVFFYHHSYAVLKKTFDDNPVWKSFWTLTTTSTNSLGVQFISTMEAKEFPFFAVQYHPEKNSFEWRVPAKRTYTSIRVSQKFINYYVNLARQNKNTFPNESELQTRLIYNYETTVMPMTKSFVSVYYFDESKINEEEGVELEVTMEGE